MVVVVFDFFGLVFLCGVFLFVFDSILSIVDVLL
jgi:hypothetical protein